MFFIFSSYSEVQEIILFPIHLPSTVQTWPSMVLHELKFLTYSAKARIVLGWYLKGSDVCNNLLRIWSSFNFFQVDVATPKPNCKSPTLRRWLLQIGSEPVDDITLVNAFKLFCFFQWGVEHIPENQNPSRVTLSKML